MSFKSKTTFRQNYLNPAIDARSNYSLKSQTSSNAPNQRYGLTLKGKALYYERHDDKIDVENDPQKDPQNTADNPQKAAIFKAIKSNPSISRVELANTIGCSESTIKTAIERMEYRLARSPQKRALGVCCGNLTTILQESIGFRKH